MITTSAVAELSTEVLQTRTNGAGLCRSGETDDWFPAEPEPEWVRARTAYERSAHRLCEGCPVRAECLELALRYEARPKAEPHGIWGGTAPWEREAILVRRAGQGFVAVAS